MKKLLSILILLGLTFSTTAFASLPGCRLYSMSEPPRCAETPPPPPTPTPITPPETSGAGSGSSFGHGHRCLPCLEAILKKEREEAMAKEIASCVKITNFNVDTGIVGDGKVHLSWNGSDDNKYVAYGTDKYHLSKSFWTKSKTGVDITGLASVNHWFWVANKCTNSPLIDPIP